MLSQVHASNPVIQCCRETVMRVKHLDQQVYWLNREASPPMHFSPQNRRDTYHLRAILIGVVRHDVKRSAGRSGIIGSSSLASHAASWMQFFMDGGKGIWASGWLGLIAATLMRDQNKWISWRFQPSRKQPELNSANHLPEAAQGQWITGFSGCESSNDINASGVSSSRLLMFMVRYLLLIRVATWDTANSEPSLGRILRSTKLCPSEPSAVEFNWINYGSAHRSAECPPCSPLSLTESGETA